MFENNAITKLLKIKYPIIQGGMAWVADADLAGCGQQRRRPRYNRGRQYAAGAP